MHKKAISELKIVIILTPGRLTEKKKGKKGNYGTPPPPHYNKLVRTGSHTFLPTKGTDQRGTIRLK